MIARVFSIPQHSTAFEEYYNHIQDGLKTLAGMDELMAGKYRIARNFRERKLSRIAHF